MRAPPPPRACAPPLDGAPRSACSIPARPPAPCTPSCAPPRSAPARALPHGHVNAHREAQALPRGGRVQREAPLPTVTTRRLPPSAAPPLVCAPPLPPPLFPRRRCAYKGSTSLSLLVRRTWGGLVRGMSLRRQSCEGAGRPCESMLAHPPCPTHGSRVCLAALARYVCNAPPPPYQRVSLGERGPAGMR